MEGSDYEKPDAITRIEQDTYKEAVYLLSVNLLDNGPSASRKLQGIGISTIGGFAEAPEEVLIHRLEKLGSELNIFARGHDASPVQQTNFINAINSVGNSATLVQQCAANINRRVPPPFQGFHIRQMTVEVFTGYCLHPNESPVLSVFYGMVWIKGAVAPPSQGEISSRRFETA